MQLKRCDWCLGNNLYIKYHDKEWGVPVHDDRILFEFLVLESAQAGLSWLTILKRRNHYKTAYDNFDIETVAGYDRNKINRMLKDAGIIRNRKKIQSSVSNAVNFLEIINQYGSFDSYIWNFTGGKTIHNKWRSVKELPSSNGLSDKISKDLKKRGFTFFGPTIVYAYLQSIGIVNDHLMDCYRYKEIYI